VNTFAGDTQRVGVPVFADEEVENELRRRDDERVVNVDDFLGLVSRRLGELRRVVREGLVALEVAQLELIDRGQEFLCFLRHIRRRLVGTRADAVRGVVVSRGGLDDCRHDPHGRE
jgi:hypothetical protein